MCNTLIHNTTQVTTCNTTIANKTQVTMCNTTIQNTTHETKQQFEENVHTPQNMKNGEEKGNFFCKVSLLTDKGVTKLFNIIIFFKATIIKHFEISIPSSFDVSTLVANWNFVQVRK